MFILRSAMMWLTIIFVLVKLVYLYSVTVGWIRSLVVTGRQAGYTHERHAHAHNLQTEISLTVVFLDRERKSEYPEGTIHSQWQGDRAKTARTDPGFLNPWPFPQLSENERKFINYNTVKIFSKSSAQEILHYDNLGKKMLSVLQMY